MCGIAGKISFNDILNHEVEVKNACQAMAYRGPDNIAVHTISKATLGHCRLSIIDLSVEANQPFYSEDKRYSIVFNGEIYNFKEVRRELEKNRESKKSSYRRKLQYKIKLKNGDPIYKKQYPISQKWIEKTHKRIMNSVRISKLRKQG